MKYYTLQTLKAWSEAKEKGYLIGNKGFIMDDEKYYSWMKHQMCKRLKGYNNEYPVWLWLSLDNINIIDTLDDDYVLLEIELSEDKVLLSNFYAWHDILNDGYFGDNKENLSQEENWEMLFNKKELDKLGFTFDNDDMQGVTGKIDLDNIKVLKYILNKMR
jgi:hypothetical protein